MSTQTITATRKPARDQHQVAPKPTRRGGVLALFAAWMLVLASTVGFDAAGQGTRTPASGSSNATPARQASTMKLQMTADGAVVATATLDNNDSARDFAALLPLNLTLKDYAATEKIADLPRALSLKGAPAAYTPLAGDLSFYAPWGNLAIFYKDGHLSSGLVRLGRIDSGLDAIRRTGAIAVRIELVRP